MHKVSINKGKVFLYSLLASVSMSPKGPCKRTQHCWPKTPNIVGPNNVVTCCVRLYGTITMLAVVAYSLKPVKRLAQQVPTFLLLPAVTGES